MGQIEYYDAIRNNYIFEITRNRDTSIKHKAMSSLRYEELNFKITFVQIGIILLSTGLTVMNSIKSYYDMKSSAIDVISILFTAFIGFVMAVYRFYKLDDRKENLCNLIENYTGVINKFNRLLHKMDTYVICPNNIEDWNKLVSNYQDEVLDNYIQIKENFDNTFNYKDIIYYKNKFKKLYLENEVINNEIETIHYYKKTLVPKEEETDDTSKVQCWKKKNLNIDYQKFLEENEKEYIKHYRKWQSERKSNQALYNQYMLEDGFPLLDPEELKNDALIGDITDNNENDNNVDLLVSTHPESTEIGGGGAGIFMDAEELDENNNSNV